MSGMQDKHQQPGKGREEQEHPQRPGQDEPKDMQGLPSHERKIQNPSRQREQEADDDLRDDER